jgi:hypothetical protein
VDDGRAYLVHAALGGVELARDGVRRGGDRAGLSVLSTRRNLPCVYVQSTRRGDLDRSSDRGLAVEVDADHVELVRVAALDERSLRLEPDVELRGVGERDRLRGPLLAVDVPTLANTDIGIAGLSDRKSMCMTSVPVASRRRSSRGRSGRRLRASPAKQACAAVKSKRCAGAKTST